jgi:hypothetical protein
VRRRVPRKAPAVDDDSDTDVQPPEIQVKKKPKKTEPKDSSATNSDLFGRCNVFVTVVLWFAHVLCSVQAHRMWRKRQWLQR